MPVKRASQPYKVAVIGGGLTGLTCGYMLSRSSNPPVSVDIYESQDRVGGVITTRNEGPWTLELGPASMQLKYEDVGRLVLKDLKLRKHIVQKKHTDVYVVKDGRPQKLGKGPGAIFSTNVLSIGGKLRAIRELFGRRLGRDEARNISIDGFFRRRFGDEVADYVIDPVIGGIYGGNTRELSMEHSLPSIWASERNHGSVIRGFLFGQKKEMKKEMKRGNDSAETARATKLDMGLRESFNYDQGMALIPRKLAEGIKESGRGNIYTGRRVKKIKYSNRRGVWRVNRMVGYDAVVTTIPSYSLNNISWNIQSIREMCDYLARKVTYAPFNILTMGFREDQVGNRITGGGILVPTKEKISVLGISFNETGNVSTFPTKDRCYTIYFGGARRPGITHLNDEDTLATACSEMEKLLGIKGKPIFHRLQRWRKGIPQYTIGYEQVHERINAVEDSQSANIVFTGTYRNGVGIPDAIHAGIAGANKVLARLRMQKS